MPSKLLDTLVKDGANSCYERHIVGSGVGIFDRRDKVWEVIMIVHMCVGGVVWGKMSSRCK